MAVLQHLAWKRIMPTPATKRIFLHLSGIKWLNCWINRLLRPAGGVCLAEGDVSASAAVWCGVIEDHRRSFVSSSQLCWLHFSAAVYVSTAKASVSVAVGGAEESPGIIWRGCHFPSQFMGDHAGISSNPCMNANSISYAYRVDHGCWCVFAIASTC